MLNLHRLTSVPFCTPQAYCLLAVLLHLTAVPLFACFCRYCSVVTSVELSWTLTHIAAERTCITGNTCHVFTVYCCMTSPRRRKTQFHLLLHVGHCVYRAVAWQRVAQIRYNTRSFHNYVDVTKYVYTALCWRRQGLETRTVLHKASR
jgi:hypothetical protein